MNILASYLKASSMTQAAFAEAISVSQPTVNRWAKGLARPTWRKASQIEKLTDGQIPVSAWVDADNHSGVFPSGNAPVPGAGDAEGSCLSSKHANAAPVPQGAAKVFGGVK